MTTPKYLARPCPWCTTSKIATVPRMRKYQTYCLQCGASGPEATTIDEARELWDNPEIVEERCQTLNKANR